MVRIHPELSRSPLRQADAAIRTDQEERSRIGQHHPGVSRSLRVRLLREQLGAVVSVDPANAARGERLPFTPFVAAARAGHGPSPAGIIAPWPTRSNV